MPALVVMRKKGHESMRVAEAQIEHFKARGWGVDGILSTTIDVDGRAPPAPEREDGGDGKHRTLAEMRAIVDRRDKDPRTPISVLRECMNALQIKRPFGLNWAGALDLIDQKLKELGA